MTGPARLIRGLLLLGSWTLFAAAVSADEPATASGPPLTLVVMDPLAAPLSCPCVEGYAQRKYEVLAKHLSDALDCQTRLVFAESLEKALQGDPGAPGRADVIIGKDSVVRADAKACKLKVTSVARLTDKTGSTTQHGLIVVPNADAAQTAADLAGYRIIFGPEEAEEKHRAALDVLKSAGVAPPEKMEIDQAGSDGACKIIELGTESVHAAAVISSYAAPLLAGCGTIKKGDLRVIAKTRPVPFITAFTCDTIDETRRGAIQQALFSVAQDQEMCTSLETLIGFVPVEPEPVATKKK